MRSRTVETATDFVQRAVNAAATKFHPATMEPFQQWLERNGRQDFDWTMAHTKLIASRIQSLVDGETENEMLVTPPRHGKSTTATMNGILYVAERFPGTEIMLICHTQDFANDVSGQIRDRADELGILGEDVTGVRHWRTKNGSNIRAFGVGTRIHGFNAKWIFVDDPIGDQQLSESQSARDTVWDWWLGNAMLRRQRGTRIMFIYTTGHYDDLGSRALKMPMPWHLTRLPAESEGEGDPLGRPEGEWLAPIDKNGKGLFDAEWYEQTKAIYMAHSPHIWWGHFQCRPSAREGLAIKPDLIEIVDTFDGDLRRKTRAWDLASATSAKADETVGALGGESNGFMFVEDVFHGRFDPGTRDSNIVSIAAQDGYNVSIRLPKDPGEGGVRTMASLSPQLRGYSYKFKPPVGSKTRRADELASLINRGKVKFRKAEWNAAVIEQLRQFPLGAHDDIVDALADLATEVMLSAEYRFPDTPTVYTSSDIVREYGNAVSERAIYTDSDLFSRVGGFQYGHEASFFYLAAVGPNGIRYVYDELAMYRMPIEAMAAAILAKCKEWDWKAKPVFCSKDLETAGSDGLSRHYTFAKKGLPMPVQHEPEAEGLSFMESLIAEGKMKVHERCRLLNAYIATTPRDRLRRDEIDPAWVGKQSLDAVRLALHNPMRAPSGGGIASPSSWETTKI